MNAGDGNSTIIREFFDLQYEHHPRYWWKSDNRYSLNGADHTWFNAKALRIVSGRSPGRALDIGAGEGADAIRLAKLGYEVDAIELSSVACEKINRFARGEGIRVNVRNESITDADLTANCYNVVIMNGLLHYIQEKEGVLEKVRAASAPAAIHIVSLFSDATPLPREHSVVPVFPDREGGAVEEFYRGTSLLCLRYERSKRETSHPGFSTHVHSYIKLIARLVDDTEPR